MLCGCLFVSVCVYVCVCVCERLRVFVCVYTWTELFLFDGGWTRKIQGFPRNKSDKIYNLLISIQLTDLNNRDLKNNFSYLLFFLSNY